MFLSFTLKHHRVACGGLWGVGSEEVEVFAKQEGKARSEWRGGGIGGGTSGGGGGTGGSGGILMEQLCEQ